MPRRSYEEIAQAHGLTRNQLMALKEGGVNPYNDDEVARAAKERRVKADPDAKLPDDLGSGGEVTIEDLEGQVKAAQDYNTVRTLKEKIAALLQAQKVRKEEGQLISRNAVEERDTRNAAAVKGALLKFVNDCPPMIEGLSAAKAQKVIKAQMMGVLESLADDQSEFWKQ